MTIDPYKEFKSAQKDSWGLFAPLEIMTTMPAAALVQFAGVRSQDEVLDVACGTGVVAITAARVGAKVRALDLTPALLDRARQNAQLAQVEIQFVEGDAELLPYQDSSFDLVLSQFGHMFAPRPEVVVKEMLRVLKPGGTLAFSTWPPEHFMGKMFSLVTSYLPALPQGIPPSPLWGDPNVVRERLGNAVIDLQFERDVMIVPSLSPQHYRQRTEATSGPIVKLLKLLKDEPKKIAQFWADLEALALSHWDKNCMRQHYLMTRATKVASS